MFKKAYAIAIFIAIGNVGYLYADNEIPSDIYTDMDGDERVFASRLTDLNRSRFSRMNAAQRAECMASTEMYGQTGNVLIPNQETSGNLSPDNAVIHVYNKYLSTKEESK